MTPALLQLAQAAPPDLANLAGNSGWFGAGLLGAVLCWLLLVHLPAKDKQLRELIQRHDDTVNALLDRHEEEEKALRETFAAALREITTHCKEEMGRVLSQIAAAGAGK